MRKPKKAKPVEATWPADKVERRAVKKLIPSARNARRHSAEQIAQVAASIKEWGWTQPVLIDEADEIIAGHGRILAAQRLKIVEVPVIVARGWSEAQKRAYALADNQLALNADWDEEMLRVELPALDGLGFDLDLIGFGENRLAKYLEEPEPADTSSKLGGLEYRVIVDCASEEQQTELLAKFEAEGLTCRALIS